jgi:hypothetical protein
MRGVPAPAPVSFSPGDGRTWRDAGGLVLLVSRNRGRCGGDWLRPVAGLPCAAAAANVGYRPKGAGEAAAPRRRDPRQPGHS